MYALSTPHRHTHTHTNASSLIIHLLFLSIAEHLLCAGYSPNIQSTEHIWQNTSGRNSTVQSQKKYLINELEYNRSYEEKWSRTNRQSNRQRTFWLQRSEKASRKVLWARLGAGDGADPGQEGAWSPEVSAWGHAGHAGCRGPRGTSGRTLSTGVGRDLCPSGTALATSRELLLEDQGQNQISYRPCKKQGRRGAGEAGGALGRGRRGGRRNT